MRYVTPLLLLAITLPAAATTMGQGMAHPPVGNRLAPPPVTPHVSWTCSSKSELTSCLQPSQAGCVNGQISYTGGCTVNGTPNLTSGTIQSVSTTISVQPSNCYSGNIQLTPTANINIATKVNGLTIASNPTMCMANHTCQISWTQPANTPMSCGGATITVSPAPATAS